MQERLRQRGSSGLVLILALTWLAAACQADAPDTARTHEATSDDGNTRLAARNPPASGDGCTAKMLTYLKASNTGEADLFGFSVALSADGSTLAVGSIFEASAATGIGGDQTDNSVPDSGAVYVFVRSGAMWSQQAYIKASNTGESHRFGMSVALSADGSTLAVGAPGETSAATGINGDQANNSAPDSGAVYVFTRNGTTWSQQAYVKASNTGTQDFFGDSVALSADGSTTTPLRTPARSTRSRATTRRGSSRHISRRPIPA